MLFSEFPPIETAAWRERIEVELRKAAAKSKHPQGTTNSAPTTWHDLAWHTPEGFTLAPFYRRDEVQPIDTNAFAHATGDWQISELVYVHSHEPLHLRAANATALGALKGGAEAITWVLDIEPNADQWEVLHKDIFRDMITEYHTYTPAYKQQQQPRTPFVALPTTVNAVEQVASALQQLREGVQTENTHPRLEVYLTVGASFFIEIAKLRALRYLLRTKIGEGQAVTLVATVDTGTWGDDPHTNKIKATTQALAAVLGGADVLNIPAFDLTNPDGTGFDRRIARNIQHLLKHESGLNRVADPLGGSYYVEAITQAIIEAAEPLT